MISAFGIDDVSKGIAQVGGALKKIPTLHPKAPPYSIVRYGNQAQKFNEDATSGNLAAKAAKRGKHFADFVPRGPEANARELKGLSGNTAHETVRRFGRATRHQDKEFQAVVHPLSGRMTALARGDQTGVNIPNPELRRTSKRRMIELAETSKNPKVKERATRNVQGMNPNIAGPNLLHVHNHPQHIPHGNKGKVAHLDRGHPSAADTGVVGMKPNFKGAVITHKPGPRGSKKTHVTFFGRGPDKLKNAAKGGANRPIEPDPAGQQKRADMDMATQPKDLPLRAQQGFGRRRIGSLTQGAQKDARKRMGQQKNIGWDNWMRSKTRSPKQATSSGIHTRETMMKRLVLR